MSHRLPLSVIIVTGLILISLLGAVSLSKASSVKDNSFRSARLSATMNHDGGVYSAATTTDTHSSNPTVFGKILRGEIPGTRVLANELGSNIFAFEDRSPRAPFHGLVIPRHFIPSIQDATVDNDDIDHTDFLELILQMEDVAHELIKSEFPEAFRKKDYILCFHVPPFISVGHLHLHVLAPASEMNFLFRSIKYNTSTRWCTGVADVIQRLQVGLPATPYKKDGNWWDIIVELFLGPRGF